MHGSQKLPYWQKIAQSGHTDCRGRKLGNPTNSVIGRVV